MAFNARESNPAAILLFGVIFAGLIGALLLGQSVAQGQMLQIAVLGASAVGITICLALGKNIWMLIPLCWLLTGRISILPLPLSVRDMGVLAAFGMFVIFYVFKKIPRFAPLNRFDLLLILNLAYLVTVYARNPVGVQAMGSAMVGGRPYADIVIAVMAFWVLQHVNLSIKEARFFPLLMAVGSLIVGGLGVLTQFFPATVPLIAPFYSGISVESYLDQQTGATSSGYRIGPLSILSLTLAGVLAAYFRPVTLLLFTKPLWSLLFYAACIAGLLSGFRSGLVYLGVILALSSYFYGGLKDLVAILMSLVLGVTGMIALQSSGIPVHPAAQRALSFIPGPWDSDIVSSAESSTDWRVEMWKIALEGEHYIKNKLLGDGFGFSAYELQIQMQAAWGGLGYIGANLTEAQLVTGAYHSGPISAIRYAGIAGLIFFTVLIVASAVYAWRTILLSKGTPFFAPALFIGIPVIYKPIEYWLVFGGFDSDMPKAIFGLACVNLVARAISEYRTVNQSIGQERGVFQPRTFLQVGGPAR